MKIIPYCDVLYCKCYKCIKIRLEYPNLFLWIKSGKWKGFGKDPGGKKMKEIISLLKQLRDEL